MNAFITSKTNLSLVFLRATLFLRKDLGFSEMLKEIQRSSTTQATSSRKCSKTQLPPKDVALTWRSTNARSVCVNSQEKSSFFYPDASTTFALNALQRWSRFHSKMGKSETFVVLRLHAKSSLTILTSRTLASMMSMQRSMRSFLFIMQLPRWMIQVGALFQAAGHWLQQKGTKTSGNANIATIHFASHAKNAITPLKGVLLTDLTCIRSWLQLNRQRILKRETGNQSSFSTHCT